MKPARALVVTALLAVGVVASTVVACDGDGSGGAEEGEGGVGPGGVEPGSCPKVDPVEGAECRLPEGTTCDLGRCGTRLARCTAGAWRYGENPAPTPPCPTAPPENEADCPACWPAAATCTYFAERCGDPDAGGAQNIAVASCPFTRWVVTIRPCRDAGADVQRDGEADGD